MLNEELQSVWPDWKLEEPEIGHGAYGKVYKIKRSLAGFGEVEYQALKVVSIPLDEDDIDILTLGQSEREAKNEYYRSMAEKLAKEATFMSDLQGNPYIVRYDDHAILPRSDGKVGWDVLIRMELLTPFKDHMAGHGFTRQDVIRLGIDICKALELCRKKDVIHRDIKPENIFISEVGNYKLGDFGVAVNADKTLGGLSKKGTYAYMAPEVYKGQPYGPTIDTYSLGIILYRLLNDGKEPFMPPKGVAEKYEDRELALSKRMQCEPLPYPENETGKLARIVMKAASPYPEDRYSSPSEMRHALEDLVDANDGELMILPMKNAESFFTKRASRSAKPSISSVKPEVEVVEEEPIQEVEAPKNNIKMIIACCCAVLIGIAAFLFLRPAPEAEYVSIIHNTEYIEVGDTLKLSYAILPEKAKAEVMWASSNDTIATIDTKGTITAHTAGVVTITAELDNGVSTTCNIRIKSDCVTEYGGIDYADVYDYNFYVATYPALAEKYANDPAGALKHFVEVGVPSGYQAIADFNVLGYAKANGRLRDIFGSDLMSYVHHYIDYGKQEGRNGLGNSSMENYETVYNGVDYSAVYDYNYYTTNNYEVFERFNVDDAKVLEYFVTVGMVQGQQGCEKFNPVSYAYEYSDVRERCRNSLKYYMDKGGFDYTPFYFDYIQVGKAAGYNGTGCHSMKGFITSYGGTDYSSVYDYNAYCLNNKDIFALLGVDDAAVLEHFVLYGQEEGRIATN